MLIRNGLTGLDLPVYGDGKQIHEWLYVEDNCRAIFDVLKKGKVGSIYNISTGEERANLDVVHAICEAIAERCATDLHKIRKRIRSVTDRPGHVVNYSVPVKRRVSLSELRPHLHTLPEHPEWVPYRTSYYNEDWGFCLAHRQFLDLKDEEYEICIDSGLQPGFLTYGEYFVPGDTADEVLISWR